MPESVRENNAATLRAGLTQAILPHLDPSLGHPAPLIFSSVSLVLLGTQPWPRLCRACLSGCFQLRFIYYLARPSLLLRGTNLVTEILWIKLSAAQKKRQDQTYPETRWTLLRREWWNFSPHTSSRKYAYEDIPASKHRNTEGVDMDR